MHMHPSTMDGCECVPVVTTTGCSSWRSEWCGGDGGSGSGRLPGLARYSTRCSAAALVRTGFSCFRFFIFVRRWPLRPNSCCLLFFPVTIPSRISCRILYGPLVMMVVDSDSLHYYFILQSSLLLYTTHSAPIKIAIYCCHTNAIISLFTYHTYIHAYTKTTTAISYKCAYCYLPLLLRGKKGNMYAIIIVNDHKLCKLYLRTHSRALGNNKKHMIFERSIHDHMVVCGHGSNHVIRTTYQQQQKLRTTHCFELVIKCWWYDDSLVVEFREGGNQQMNDRLLHKFRRTEDRSLRADQPKSL